MGYMNNGGETIYLCIDWLCLGKFNLNITGWKGASLRGGEAGKVRVPPVGVSVLLTRALAQLVPDAHVSFGRMKAADIAFVLEITVQKYEPLLLAKLWYFHSDFL